MVVLENKRTSSEFHFLKAPQNLMLEVWVASNTPPPLLSFDQFEIYLKHQMKVKALFRDLLTPTITSPKALLGLDNAT